MELPLEIYISTSMVLVANTNGRLAIPALAGLLVLDQLIVTFDRSTHDIDIAILSVRPSVCPSVRDVPVSDENGLTYCHSFFSPYGSPIILVLLASNIFTKFRRGYPCRGAKYRWGIKISRFSTNKSLYLADDTR